MTLETYLITVSSLLAGVIVVLAKFIVSSRLAQQSREDNIHAEYKADREKVDQLLHETRREFTKLLYSLTEIQEED